MAAKKTYLDLKQQYKPKEEIDTYKRYSWIFNTNHPPFYVSCIAFTLEEARQKILDELNRMFYGEFPARYCGVGARALEIIRNRNNDLERDKNDTNDHTIVTIIEEFRDYIATAPPEITDIDDVVIFEL
jgi:hypothetical protein